MSENKKKFSKFPLGLCIYAGAFLLVTVIGLIFFWNYMSVYEQTRPATALNAYAQQLTAEHIYDASEDVINQVDHALQSVQQCKETVINALSEGFTFVKKATVSTKSKHVYMILCGKQLIGTIELSQCQKAAYGFTAWEVTSEAFDLWYLLSEPVTVTVPATLQVSVCGNALSEKHITDNSIPYPLLEKFYEDYSLPYLCTYTAGPFLGTPQIRITDSTGKEITLAEDTDFSDFLPQCTDAQKKDLDDAADSFVRKYVDFVSEANDDTSGNYSRLCALLVPNSDLHKRVHGILDGLLWVSDRHASLESMEIHKYIQLEDNRYLCQLTYVINTRTNAGATRSENHVTVIFQNTASGLKAEMMVNE